MVVTKFHYNIELFELDLANFKSIEAGIDELIANFKRSTSGVFITGILYWRH
jgi:hypothetical protein